MPTKRVIKLSDNIVTENWRAEELERAGTSHATARLLAGTKEDLHVMLDAIAHDCPEHRLIEIFGPDPNQPKRPPAELDDPARQSEEPITAEDSY